MRELWCRECRKCRQCSEGLSPVGWNSRACIQYVQRKRYTTAELKEYFENLVAL